MLTLWPSVVSALILIVVTYAFLIPFFHPFTTNIYGPTRISGTINVLENTDMNQEVEISALHLWGLYSSGRRQIINEIL